MSFRLSSLYGTEAFLLCKIIELPYLWQLLRFKVLRAQLLGACSLELRPAPCGYRRALRERAYMVVLSIII